MYLLKHLQLIPGFIAEPPKFVQVPNLQTIDSPQISV